MISIAQSRKRTFFYWPATILLAAIYAITGIGNLIPFAHIAADMQRLGYPAYFMPFLGIWKLLAAGALVVPVFRKLRQFAYMGMVIDLTGAIYSRVAIHDTAVSVFVPVLILLLVVTSWWQWSLRRRSPGG
jgi:hypothetical protein